MAVAVAAVLFLLQLAMVLIDLIFSFFRLLVSPVRDAGQDGYLGAVVVENQIAKLAAAAFVMWAILAILKLMMFKFIGTKSFRLGSKIAAQKAGKFASKSIVNIKDMICGIATPQGLKAIGKNIDRQGILGTGGRRSLFR